MDSVLVSLKQTKNSLIGNRTAKLALQREGAIPVYVARKFRLTVPVTNSSLSIVDYVNYSPQPITGSRELTTEIRMEAAHVVASLAYGEPHSFFSLKDVTHNYQGYRVSRDIAQSAFCGCS